MAVALYRIVEHRNKIRYRTLSFLTGGVYFSLDNWCVNCSKKGFCNGVVVTISSPTHRLVKVVLSHKGQVISDALLAALMTMN